MVTGSFTSQFSYFHLRNSGSWFESLPTISAEMTRSATNLSGTYSISFPNPVGVGLNYFNYFDNQELWFAHIPTNTMYRAMSGQVNAIAPTSKLVMKIDGRGLNGLLTDPKITQSFSSKRGDFILCDPTYGVLRNIPHLTTWNAFTNEYDKFDYWDTARWGAQPAWADTIAGNLEMTGAASGTRSLTGATYYNYKVIEFYAKLSAADSDVYIGLVASTGTSYARFKLTTAAVACTNNDGTGEASTNTTTAITQTNWNYYRIEWDSTSVRFFVNGVLEVTSTTKIPSLLMRPQIAMVDTAETLTVDYMKIIAMTALFDSYAAKGQIAMDVVSDITSVGNNQTDFSFYIDDDWDFHAFEKTSIPSGYSYGYNSAIYTSPYEKVSIIDPSYEAKDLYNAVRITGGSILNTVSAPTWVDTFTGNGVQTAFALGYVAQKPLTLLQVGGSAKTEDTDFTVSYGSDSTIVQFATAPAGAASIQVRYNYYTPIIATAVNQESIDAYNGVKREYEKADENITSQSRASNLANALLAYYKDPRTVIKITIPLDPRLQIGTTVNIDAPYFGINDTAYEIIEMSHKMAIGIWETKLTLASSEINTTGEIIREILQQIKNLKNRSETNATILNEVKIQEEILSTESTTVYSQGVGNALIGDHPTNSELDDSTYDADNDSQSGWAPA